jgi:hypothetical protein
VLLSFFEILDMDAVFTSVSRSSNYDTADTSECHSRIGDSSSVDSFRGRVLGGGRLSIARGDMHPTALESFQLRWCVEPNTLRVSVRHTSAT